ncbi:ankyrin repeat-containing domain protein [Xylogone sp. PMI_703]|nr:ankyrin repeat-containing domain protein [Xylogone sp. PMI_703]
MKYEESSERSMVLKPRMFQHSQSSQTAEPNHTSSIRAYRMKLDEWNMRKNRSSKDPRAISRMSPRSSASDGAFDTDADSLLDTATNHPLTKHIGGGYPTFDLHSIAVPLISRTNSQKDERLSDTEADAQYALRYPSHPSITTVRYQQHSPDHLHLAITNGTLQEVRNILATGVDVNSQDTEGNTPLHTALRAGRLRMVAPLIQHSANVNLQDKNWNTPLHVLLDPAIVRGQDLMPTLLLLLSSGAEINIRNIHGQCVLLHAISRLNSPVAVEDVQIVEALLKSFTGPRFASGNDDLTFACFLNATAAGLIRRDKCSSPLDKEWRAMSAAVASCIDVFLERGAYPGVVVLRTTLLDFCLRYMFLNNDDTLNLIIKLLETADVNVADSEGNLPLHYLLLNTSYQASMDSGTTILGKIIRKVNVNVNQPNNQGKAALDLLFEGTTVETCTSLTTVRSARILISAGAKPTRLDASRRTVFDCPSLSTEAKPDAICFRKILLELLLKGDIANQSQEDNEENTAQWALYWRAARAEDDRTFRLKDYIDYLKWCPPIPACPQFYECTLKLLADAKLERYMGRCLALRKQRNTVTADSYCEAYVNTLRICRQHAIPIDSEWYKKVLDILI